jgi:hypothetical protein
MSTYRQKLEEQVVAELREWLDAMEDQYGPASAFERRVRRCRRLRNGG